jgi:hypothetical protein
MLACDKGGASGQEGRVREREEGSDVSREVG